MFEKYSRRNREDSFLVWFWFGFFFFFLFLFPCPSEIHRRTPGSMPSCQHWTEVDAFCNHFSRQGKYLHLIKRYRLIRLFAGGKWEEIPICTQQQVGRCQTLLGFSKVLCIISSSILLLFPSLFMLQKFCILLPNFWLQDQAPLFFQYAGVSF